MTPSAPARSRVLFSIFTRPSHSFRCAAYYADIAAGSAGREIAFNPELGLAMEVLSGGATIAQLWNVM
jgi:hypothetical protein